MLKDDTTRFAPPAFTLVELILVMAVLATVMALAAPSLSRSLRNRNLDQEAKRFIALTEYARSEAVSQAVPMIVWIDADGGRFGAEPKAGFTSADNTKKEYPLNSDVHFDLTNAPAAQDGLVTAVEFEPDGTPDPSSMATVQLADRFKNAVAIAKTQDGWGYEIVKDTQEK
jgi:type II secretion system protein H